MRESFHHADYGGDPPEDRRPAGRERRPYSPIDLPVAVEPNRFSAGQGQVEQRRVVVATKTGCHAESQPGQSQKTWAALRCRLPRHQRQTAKCQFGAIRARLHRVVIGLEDRGKQQRRQRIVDAHAPRREPEEAQTKHPETNDGRYPNRNLSGAEPPYAQMGHEVRQRRSGVTRQRGLPGRRQVRRIRDHQRDHLVVPERLAAGMQPGAQEVDDGERAQNQVPALLDPNRARRLPATAPEMAGWRNRQASGAPHNRARCAASTRCEEERRPASTPRPLAHRK